MTFSGFRFTPGCCCRRGCRVVQERSPISLKFTVAGAADGPQIIDHLNGVGLATLNREWAFDDIYALGWSGLPEGPGVAKCSRELELSFHREEVYDADHHPVPLYLYWSQETHGNRASEWNSWFEIGHDVEHRKRWITYAFRLFVAGNDYGAGVWKIEEAGVDGPFHALDLQARAMTAVALPPASWPGTWSAVTVHVSGYRP